MWAVRVVAPYRFEAINVPAPKESELGAGEVVLQMSAGGICGSDLPVFAGRIPANREYVVGPDYGPEGSPLHELVGVVVSSNSDLEVGQRVVGWARVQDGLKELVVAESRSLHPLGPDSGLLAHHETIMQPLACVLHAVGRMADVAGARAAVIGLGPMGLLFTHVLRSLGAAHVMGIDPIDRADVAGRFGIDEVCAMPSDRWVRWLPDRERPTVIVEAVGHQVGSLNHSIEAVAPEGQVLYFGIADDAVYPVEMKALQRKNLTLISGNTPFPHRRAALAKAESYLKGHPGLAEQYVTDVFGRDAVQEAYERAMTPRRGGIKVAIRW